MEDFLGAFIILVSLQYLPITIVACSIIILPLMWLVGQAMFLWRKRWYCRDVTYPETLRLKSKCAEDEDVLVAVRAELLPCPTLLPHLVPLAAPNSFPVQRDANL